MWSGLQAFLCHVGVGDLTHDDQAAQHRAERRQVPGQLPDGGREPHGADSQEQTAAAQQVGQEARRCVVTFQFGERPALHHGGVDQRHGGQALEPRPAHRHQTNRTVPGGEVGLPSQVFIVDDGYEARGSTGQAQALQDPVQPALALVFKHSEGGAMGREDQDGFSHEEGELSGGKESC